MIVTKIYDAFNKPNQLEQNEMVDFIFDNLEQHGDKKNDIQKAIDCATKEIISFGGFAILLIEDKEEITIQFRQICKNI